MKKIPSYRIESYAGMAIFVMLAYTLLAVSNQDYLKKTEELSFFVCDTQFFHDCMEIPGGFLSWISSFLTQLFFHPWLGATVMILLLIGLWITLYKALTMPRAAFPLASIPSIMMLLAFLSPGYLIFTSKTPGYPYLGIIGLYMDAIMYWAYRHNSTAVWKLSILTVAILTYPLFGIYSLLGISYICLHEIFSRHRNFIVIITGVAAIALFPRVIYYIAGVHLMESQLYTSGLPRFGIDNMSIYGPYIFSFAFIGILIILRTFYAKTKGKSHLTASISELAFAVATIALLTYRYQDKNFATYLRIDINMDENNYGKAIEAARALEETPTRTISLHTHAALFHSNLAGDSLFSFRQGDAEYNSPMPNLALRTTMSRNLLYRFGRINDCYRWSMEDMVEYGPKVEYLKYLSKCALLNGEYNLARRYLHLLSKTMFHKDWAAKYLDYADHPEKMDKDAEFSSIRPLMAYNDHIGGDAGLIESYLSTTIASMAGGPPPLVELSLQFNLMRKDIANFWPRFILYANSHERIPRHYQEAAILFSTLERQFDWHQFNIDEEVAGKFEKFMQMAGQNSGMSDEANLEYFRPEFGDTYWYYYFFIKNLKTS